MSRRPTQEFLDKLRNNLSPEQVPSVEAQVEEWDSKHPPNPPISKLGETWSFLPKTAANVSNQR